MSLVGTRPPTVDEFKMYESYHKRRLSMKPGLTGMWQVSGRSDIEDFEEVVRLDLEYIDNWSQIKGGCYEGRYFSRRFRNKNFRGIAV